MKTICIIPARGGSKGLKDKNIIDVAGKPLIAWSIEQAKTSEYVTAVYVTSDSDDILLVARKYGAKTIKRPENLASDTASAEDALLHALYEIITKDVRRIDYVVFLQPTSPVREASDIDKAIQLMKSENYDSLFSAVEAEDLCLWEKDEDGKLISANYDYSNRKRRQDFHSQYIENGSIYVFKPEILISNQNRLGGEIGISIMEPWKVYEIDNQSDIEICEFYIKKLIWNSKLKI